MKKAPLKVQTSWLVQCRKNFGNNQVRMLNVLNLAITKQLHAHHFRGDNGKDYYPHAATWLNQGRWGDAVVTKRMPRESDEEVKADAALTDDEVAGLRERHEKAVGEARRDSRSEPHAHLPCDLEKPEQVREHINKMREAARRGR